MYPGGNQHQRFMYLPKVLLLLLQGKEMLQCSLLWVLLRISCGDGNQMQRPIYNSSKLTLRRHHQHLSVEVNILVFRYPPLKITKVGLVLLVWVGISESDVKSLASGEIYRHAEVNVRLGCDLEIDWGGVALPGSAFDANDGAIEVVYLGLGKGETTAVVRVFTRSRVRWRFCKPYLQSSEK